MEDAIVTGGRVPKTVMALITDSSGKTDANALDAARAAALSANVAMKTQDDFHDFVAHKKQWKKHYDDLFKKKVAELKAAKQAIIISAPHTDSFCNVIVSFRLPCFA